MRKKIIYSLLLGFTMIIGVALWMYNQKQLSYTIPSHDDISKMKLEQLEWEKKYELAYEFINTQGSIFVNNMPAMGALDEKTSGYTMYYGINSYIFKPGTQKITVEIYPLDGQSTFSESSSFDFNIKEVDRRNNGYYIIKDSVVTYSFKANEELSSKDKIVFEAEFVADVGYKNTLYDGAVDLNTIEPKKLRQLVLSASSKLIKNIKAKNYTNIEDVYFFNRKSANLSSYWPIDNKEGVFKSINSLLRNGFKFVEVNIDDVKYTILRDSRFVYVRLKDGTPLITVKDDGVEASDLCIFFMPKGSNELFLF